MSANKDVFADLFAPKKKDLSKLSLAERQKLTATPSSQTNGANYWSGLDLLSGGGAGGIKSNSNNNINQSLNLGSGSPNISRSDSNSNSNSHPSRSGAGTPIAHSGISTPTFGLLSPQNKSKNGSVDSFANIYNGSIKSNIGNGSGNNNNLNNVQTSSNGSSNDLDDLFGLGVASSDSNNSAALPQTHQPEETKQSQDIDSLFAVFDSAPVVSNTNNTSHINHRFSPDESTTGRSSSQPLDDRTFGSYQKISNNTDAFASKNKSSSSLQSSTPAAIRRSRFQDQDNEFSTPQRPSRHRPQNNNNNYDDIPSRPQRSGPEQQQTRDVHRLFDNIASKGGPPEDLNQVVNELSNELFTSASNFFNKSKKAINKNIEKYQAQKKAELNGKPAWMYQQERYKQKANWNDSDDDGEVVDFDGTVLKGGKVPSGSNSKSTGSNENGKRGASLRPFSERHGSDQDLPQRPRRKPDQTAQKAPAEAQSSAQNQSQGGLVNLFGDMGINGSGHNISTPSLPARQSQQQQQRKASNSLAFTAPRRENNTQATNIRQEPHIDAANLTRFKQYRTLGTNFFKEGNFTSALLNYQDALKVLPYGHSLQIIAYSNLTTSYVRLGDTKNALLTADEALEMIKATNRSLDEPVVENGNGNGSSKLVKDFWLKLVTKKAETLESLERYPEALANWKLVLENGGATKTAIDAKRRCLEAINPSKKMKLVPSSRSKSSTTTSSSGQEALRRVQENNARAESLEQEKFQLHDKVETKVNQWKHSKEDNIRALLASLDLILWPEANWKKITMADLVLDKKVKINYMKAVAKTHPDKISQNATTEQQLIAQSVFVTLNKAWDKFKQQNNIK